MCARAVHLRFFDIFSGFAKLLRELSGQLKNAKRSHNQ